MDTQNFIEKAKEVHGNKYDYSKVEYINSKTKVCIICPEHGEFYMKTGNHINGKQGCPKCGKIKSSNSRKKTTEDFIKQSREVHGDKYDYSKVVYKNAFGQVCIICPEHGEFWQTAHDHLRGAGCKKCSHNKTQNITKECALNFTFKSCEVHGNKYDYSKVKYKNAISKVCIICPEHGEFWQTPNKHLSGQGCPICKESSLEENIRVILENNNIKYQREKRFNGFNRRFDFYLPNDNIIIECQGIQHFKETNYFKNSLEENLQRDKEKYEWCKNNNFTILYFTNENFKKYIPYNQGVYTYNNTFFNIEKLIEARKLC